MFDVRSNIREVLSFVDRVSDQYPFAVATALTRAVRAARDAMPREADAAFDKPTPFTRSAFYFVPATKLRLLATVGVKDIQARYLVWQVQGGRRQPTRKALRLPAVVQLNEYGNLPRGIIRQLVARAQAGKRATKTQARRFGVSQELDLFYGEPGDGRPAGIYKRVPLPGSKNRLVPVVVFPSVPAQYEARLDFYGAAARVVSATFDRALVEAMARAKATAR